MEDLFATLRDLAGIACLGGLAVCLPLGVAGYLVYYLGVRRPRQRAAPPALARAMGLAPFTPPGTRRVWYVGQHAGRVFAMTPSIRGTGRRFGVPMLRVVMEVRAAGPLGGYVLRTAWSPDPLDTFDLAFKAQKNAGGIVPEARQAMLEFVRQTPAQPAAAMTLAAPRGRNLWLRDRGESLEREPLPEARVLLEHEVDRVETITPERLRAALDEMAEVAQVLDRTL